MPDSSRHKLAAAMVSAVLHVVLTTIATAGAPASGPRGLVTAPSGFADPGAPPEPRLPLRLTFTFKDPSTIGIYGPYGDRYVAIKNGGNNSFFREPDGTWCCTVWQPTKKTTIVAVELAPGVPPRTSMS